MSIGPRARSRLNAPHAAACAAALVVLATALEPPPAQAATLSLAAAVKAAFLYKFGAFVQWPAARFAAPTDPARLCIVGADPFGPALDQLVKGQQIDGHPIAVARAETIEANLGCDILFAAGSPKQSIADEIEAVRGQPVLTVTDGARRAADQGIVNFVMREGRVRFQINDAVAAQAGLTISSKLLSLAVSSGSSP